MNRITITLAEYNEMVASVTRTHTRFDDKNTIKSIQYEQEDRYYLRAIVTKFDGTVTDYRVILE